MDISRHSALFLDEPSLIHHLPDEVVEILRRGSNLQYLDTISRLALDPAYTDIIFTTHEPLSVEICGRWLSESEFDDFSALIALARVISLIPYSAVYVKRLLSRRRGILSRLASQEVTALNELPLKTLEKLLLALYRLLRFDNEAFASNVSPAQLQILLRHVSPSVRYISVRILCIYLHASDITLLSITKTYVGQDEINGAWDGQMIDYTFFELWERNRLENLENSLRGSEKTLEEEASNEGDPLRRRVISTQEISETVACIGGVLIPKLDSKDVAPSSITLTKNTNGNMHSLAEGIKSSRPLLVTGPQGTGKTSLIKDIARKLGRITSMVTLHLNEQTDAKLLIGMYTSANNAGSFSWQPGILTSAVMKGHWVFIEDLDRAPKEILSILLPLIERRELLVPHWGESVHAAPDFKLIATIRSIGNDHGEYSSPVTRLMGFRHWYHVPLPTLPDQDLAEIVIKRYPLLHAYTPGFIKVYQTVRDFAFSNHSGGVVHFNNLRSIGPQDLLKWCERVQDLLVNAGITSGHDSISDAIHDSIFLEAVDCFTGSYPPGPERTAALTFIGQGLHIPAARTRHCLTARKPDLSISDSSLRIGRTNFQNPKKHIRASFNGTHRNTPFATTDHVARILESVAVAVKMIEPCLLVGETGSGKTTIVQQLAMVMGRKLTIVNLSQQSEAGDLLGGFKPVNMRVLAIPMTEEFEELLTMTFTSRNNQNYLETLGKLVSKGRWAKVLVLWQEALQTIEKRFESLGPDINEASEEPKYKKRRLQSSKLRKLRGRWNKFTSDVQIFQSHLASGSKGFAFSFVEGNIIKAARRGDWVLLDEINLASPDTLESLADLFSSQLEGGPSILLSESNNTERIYAHETFRVFGAMNPATDIGKRNLPTSLRSRFTEIFIEAPDKDLENLLPVVKTYLGNHHHIDARASVDIAGLYLDIQKLVHENRLVDGSKSKPHFSLRTLSRTLIYVLDTAPTYGLRRAIFEGFAMSFLTALDGESKSLLLPLIERHIFSNPKSSKAVLHQTPRAPPDGKAYVQFKHYWIAQGAGTIERQPRYIITPFIEQNLLSLVRATSSRRFPVLLQGPTSSGKTSMIEYLARMSGNKFIRINNHEHTDLQEYLGTYASGPDGRLQYQEGVLAHALREGYWVVLDELNLAPTDVLEALNRLLDDNRELLIPETQQILRPHENFMLFATQNPPGLYGGRKVLSRAFRNRFVELHFADIPENELETILCQRSQIAPSFCSKIVTVYKRLSALRQKERVFEQNNSFATLRDLFRWASRNMDNKEQLAINGYFLLAERVRNNEDRQTVRTVIEEVMRVNIEDDRLYGTTSISDILSSQNLSSSGIVWTKSMRRLGVLLTEALRNKEPILLVGETGSGKTTICQTIADLMHTKLHILNAHQNMETGDIIGAQRPVRNKAHIESQLSQDLVAALKDCCLYRKDNAKDLSALLRMYEEIPQDRLCLAPAQRRLTIESNKSRMASLFEWVDSNLVAAMRNGDHFLLDEISLADDSVLERLNSVLEPERTLLLAEKGTKEDPVSASSGFQFMATMNPGGDYGKRELSPALRNRFTEIWVPNTSDEEEMLELVQVKLLPSFSIYSKPMVTFAAWYSSTYNIGTPHISIRDLLTWVDFINSLQHSSPALGLVHGAAMVYIDRLGSNPASKLTVADDAVSTARSNCISKLDELFGHDPVFSIYNQPNHLWSDDGSLNIGPFSLTKAPGILQETNYSLLAPTTRSNSLKIIRALQLRKPILIEGSPGVGKTTLVAALASAVRMPLTRINLSDQTDLMDLFGSDVPMENLEAAHFGWLDAPFLRAMRNGEWVLLDEMNLASQSVLEGLNACLDHRGQVYISELDRTFARHSNFMVFAAQNPHHQGGGRKGLPASFVNRFTVLFAESMQPEDLMHISNEMFPTAFNDDKENVVGSVVALNQMFQDNQTIGLQGGPWEINLRDVLRWLHLLSTDIGLTSFASVADFQQLVLLQRFRTPGDIAAVSRLIQQKIPQNLLRSYSVGKCANLVEVGLSILPRTSRKRPTLGTILDTVPMNLAIAESVMLCVENKWPCLLVGASGSGKTNTVLKLADSVGADVLEISMNAEMDTMDLIGGYEQMDPRRESASLIKKFRENVHQAMICDLEAENQWSEELSTLALKLHDLGSDPLEIIRLIIKASEDFRNLKSDGMLKESKDLLNRTSTDNRARFEWIDGILVKGLKQGKWIILDNVNLCNASVLDRLNSLLEPNGLLNINEHRNSDGSAKVVHPHKDFRLFMTMDPIHGEISRAMRNRSVELFIPTQHQSPTTDILGPNDEPSLSHFRLFQTFKLSDFHDGHFKHMLKILFDHFTSSDIQICHRWETQLKNGLANLSHSKIMSILSLVRTYKWMHNLENSIVHSVFEVYDRLEKQVNVSAPGFASMQPIQPFNNPYLLVATDKNPPSSNLRLLGECLEILQEIGSYLQLLTSLERNIILEEPIQLNCLERSIISLRTNRFRTDETQPLITFLKEMGLELQRHFDVKSFDQINHPESTVMLFRDVQTYLQDVLELANSLDFDGAEFQVYQVIGRSICARASHDGLSADLTASLCSTLSSKLDMFKSSWQLSSGFSMENLWIAFKPDTAVNMAQLDIDICLKDLADRFDAFKFHSGVSILELDIIEKSILKSYDFVDYGFAQASTLYKEVEEAVKDLQIRSDISETSLTPYFQAQFECLSQCNAGYGNSNSSDPSLHLLRLLANKPTRELMKFGPGTDGWVALSKLQQMTMTHNPSMELALVRGVLPLSLLRKLQDVKNVSLRSLKLLSQEMDVLSRVIVRMTEAIQSDPVVHWAQLIHEIQFRVLQALDLSDFADAPSDVKRLLHRFGRHVMGEAASDRLSTNLLACLESLTKPQEFDDLVAPSQNGEKYAKLALGSIRFFTGCLLLYVPDCPLDPALRPMVERARYNKRKQELENKLRALRDFGFLYTGHTQSFRIQRAESDLQKLGIEPQVPPVVRPQVSQLPQLHAEFNSILSTIVLKSSDNITLESVLEGGCSETQEIDLMRMNIAQSITRLSQGFQAYEDLTKPLIAILHGLDAGLALAVFAGKRTDSSYDAIKFIAETTPFLCTNIGSFNRITLADLQARCKDHLDLRFHFLECVAVTGNLSPKLDADSQNTMLQVFHSLYQEWKDHLGKDQQRNATQSSLYRYRGSEMDNDEADEEDFLLLFPAYEDSPAETDEKAKSDNNPSQQARHLAQLQQKIFQNTHPSSSSILQLLRTATQSIAELWQNPSPASHSSLPPETMLSALIMSLDENKENLRGSSIQEKFYNFYTDSNLSEAQKLVQLIEKVQTKFIELQQTWPEHATLSDVLRTASELLALRHSEPVAKLLTKTEQLHGYVHEWQVVASKQYTAITLYNQLTELLVSWRRLELSTWARLLDVEDQKCYDDADSWWFIVYEVVIAVPMSLINDGDDLSDHTKHLFQTLSEFLTSTSLGQYSRRLSLISCFESHIQGLEDNFPAMSVVRNAIMNFVRFFSHFKEPIRQNLCQGRRSLDKDMKEILLLASWKDISINALRESAKRSHHKLFKIIRKYRALLSGPSEDIIGRGIPPLIENSGPLIPIQDLMEVPLVDSRAFQFCQVHLKSWQEKPERFKNTASTVRRMSLMGRIPFTAMDVSSYLSSYISGLRDDMKTLRKETPSKARKENAGLVKHLKARKRKLFADTLKTLRRMGFRFNTDAEALAKQGSLAVILANTSFIKTQSWEEDLEVAEHSFHTILNLMPQVKGKTRDHSDDLTHEEVTRSLGYLESLLSMILKQRNTLAISIADFETFNSTAKILRNLWAPESYTVRKQSPGMGSKVEEFNRILKTMPAILEAGAVIIEKNNKLGGEDNSIVLEELSTWTEKSRAVSQEFDTLPNLPMDLASSMQEQAILEAELLFQSLEVDLDKLIIAYPRLKFVLEHLQAWTYIHPQPNSRFENGHQNLCLEEIDRNLSSVTDSVLVALQQIEGANSSMPLSENDAKWFKSADKSLADGLESLHLGDIDLSLKTAIVNIQHLDSSEDNDLRLAGALGAMAMPIIQQHCNVSRKFLARQCRTHRLLCELASTLVSAFSDICSSGFCSPTENTSAGEEHAQKLEGGTGLGEGEGAEDISKDIQDDEDISELAQEKGNDKAGEEIHNEDDAVNMDHDELEGELGEGSDTGSDGESASEGNGDEIDEEIGSVDELDPSAVDEKLWDGEADEAEKEKEGSKAKGEATEQDQIAAESAAQDRNGANDETANEEETNEEGAEEDEGEAQEEVGMTDPHTQEGQSLDLPEQMDLENLEGSDSEADSNDNDIDGMSDVEQEQANEDTADQQDEDGGDTAEEETADLSKLEADYLEDENRREEDGETVGSPVDTEPSDDNEEQDPDQRDIRQDLSENATYDPDKAAPSDERGPGQDIDGEQDEDQETSAQAQANKGDRGGASEQDNQEAVSKEGLPSSSKPQREDGGRQESQIAETSSSQAFKKLGDALEKWHRQMQQIRDATDQDNPIQAQSNDIEMVDQDFEHLQDEQAEGETQALGAATDEQARALDDRAFDSEMRDEARNFSPEEIDQEGTENIDNIEDEIYATESRSKTLKEQSWPSALIVKDRGSWQDQNPQSSETLQAEDIQDLDTELSTTHLQSSGETSLRSPDDARRLWLHHESQTRDLSLTLTEQLRLILAPTTATKMRGDFRTGKRLNIKRIIPYIASQYKRDKIWMRRSIPSKRNYQIMLAVDDSKSMGESNSSHLAFETLALVSKSLSMLEAGELCILGFGNETHVAHDFDRPFSSEAGAQMFQHFTFQQTKTNVRTLISQSISLFRSAKQKSRNLDTDLWQLELIISDGICEDHDTVRRLVRQAQEEHIMIVFVIVDALVKGESIMDMKTAVFENEDEAGEPKLKIRRYLDGFPFPYYLVVGDVKELPGVLAQALRQWFSEVADTG